MLLLIRFASLFFSSLHSSLCFHLPSTMFALHSGTLCLLSVSFSRWTFCSLFFLSLYLLIFIVIISLLTNNFDISWLKVLTQIEILLQSIRWNLIRHFWHFQCVAVCLSGKYAHTYIICTFTRAFNINFVETNSCSSRWISRDNNFNFSTTYHFWFGSAMKKKREWKRKEREREVEESDKSKKYLEKHETLLFRCSIGSFPIANC